VCPPFSALYRTGDGTCNNAEHPEWGASFRPFQRFLPAEYGDGVEAFRRSVQGGALPTARTVSALVHRHRNITTSQFTTMVMQWGQFLDHDLTCKNFNFKLKPSHSFDIHFIFKIFQLLRRPEDSTAASPSVARRTDRVKPIKKTGYDSFHIIWFLVIWRTNCIT
jgi:hypothetical protein